MVRLFILTVDAFWGHIMQLELSINKVQPLEKLWSDSSWQVIIPILCKNHKIFKLLLLLPYYLRSIQNIKKISGASAISLCSITESWMVRAAQLLIFMLGYFDFFHSVATFHGSLAPLLKFHYFWPSTGPHRPPNTTRLCSNIDLDALYW